MRHVLVYKRTKIWIKVKLIKDVTLFIFIFNLKINFILFFLKLIFVFIIFSIFKSLIVIKYICLFYYSLLYENKISKENLSCHYIRSSCTQLTKF